MLDTICSHIEFVLNRIRENITYVCKAKNTCYVYLSSENILNFFPVK